MPGKMSLEYMKRWREKNRGHIRAYERDRARHLAAIPEERAKQQAKRKLYEERHPDRVKASKARWQRDNADYMAAAQQRYKRRDPWKYILQTAKLRAKKYGVEFSITKQDIYVPSVCPILGVPLQLYAGDRLHTPSLDRIDNSKGYTKENTRIISARANLLKRDGTLAEFEALVRYMRGST